jgi:hypothetical protein
MKRIAIANPKQRNKQSGGYPGIEKSSVVVVGSSVVVGSVGS